MILSMLSCGRWLFESSTLCEKYWRVLWSAYMLVSSVAEGCNEEELSPP